MDQAPISSAQPILPIDEPARLEALQSYGILDTPRDGAFDEITRLAARFFNMPIAIVSLVDQDRVWFKSAYGLGDLRQIDRGPGLCAAAILDDKCYVANDLRQDTNSMANLLVAAENGLRFYAAAPLRTSQGHNLGTFCVLDTKPRDFSDTDAADLQGYAALVMAQMEHVLAGRELANQANTIASQSAGLSRAITHDPLTGLHNRTAARVFFDEVQSDIESGHNTSILVLDIDHFKSINVTYGYKTGDMVLVELARRLKSMVRFSDHVVRSGGAEFMIILRHCPPHIASRIGTHLRKTILDLPVQADGNSIEVSLSGGLCHSIPGATVDDMIRSADAALFAAKEGGRARVVESEPLAA